MISIQKIGNEPTKSVDKALSMSDGDASFIKKGDRDTKIGYKPQLGRSKNWLYQP